MARYEEERYGGQRGSGGARRGGQERWRDREDDFDQQERDRYRSSEYGRDYEEGRHGGSEGSWRGQSYGDTGRSLGGRDVEGYDEDSYGAAGREGNRYGSQGTQGGQGSQGRWSSQRYGQGYQGTSGSQRFQGYPASQGYQGGTHQGMRDYNPSQGFGWSPEQSAQGYQGSQGFGQASGFYGSHSQRGYGAQDYDEGTTRGSGQGSWRGSQQYGLSGRGGSQADGWSSEPDEMRWGRQQGLYGSSEYGGYISSQRSQSDYQSHVGKGPKNWARSDDRIREEVNEVLARHPEIDASEIEVRVEKGEVTLTGTVDDRRTKRLAEDIVERVFGVKDVENKIKVKGGFFGFGGGRDRDVTGKADKDTASEETTSRRSTTGSTTGSTTTNR